LYAGHGNHGGHQIIDNMVNYRQTFLNVTSQATTQTAAIDLMKRAFPGFA
jgi:hypothetical protein